MTEGLGGGRGSCETIRIWDGAHMAEPRTRRGALTAALTPLGETYIVRALPRPRRSSMLWFNVGKSTEALL